MYECMNYISFEPFRRVVLQEIDMLHPFSLAIFEDTLYWSDWTGGMLMSCNKFTGKNKQIIIKEMGMKIMGISAYHPLVGANSNNPCKGHQCSHLCLPKPKSVSATEGKITCACPADMVLQSDSRTCKSSTTNALVVYVEDKIFTLKPHKLTKSSFEFVGEANSPIESLTTNSKSGDIFAYSGFKQVAYQFGIKNKDVKTKSFHANILHLQIDAINENLYWIDPLRKSIMAQSLTTGFTRVIFEHLINPRALVFCNKRQELYFLDESKLVSAFPHGKQSYIVSDNIPKTVHLMVYQEANDTLILGDNTAKTVHLFNLGTRDLSIFLSGITSLVSMAVFDGYFYWTQLTGYDLFWVRFDR